MTYAHARRLSVYPTQSLRGYPTQPLRGLGELSQQQAQVMLNSLAAQVQRGLDDLVSLARRESSRIAADFKRNWFTYIRVVFSFDTEEEVHRAADEWASNIVSYAEQVRDTLRKPGKDNLPFFVREPDVAARLLREAETDLDRLIMDFSTEVAASRFSDTVTAALEAIIGFVMQIAQIIAVALGRAFASFPIGGLAIAAVAAALVWYKFLR